MPARANSLESAFFAGALAAALLGFNTMASSAAECFDNPHVKTGTPGHWYYHSDRTQRRRCWFFIPAQATADTPVPAPPGETAGPASAAPAATVGNDSRQSWLSFFLPGFLQPPSPPQQQSQQQSEVQQTQPNTVPDTSDETTQTASPRPARRHNPRKIVREQPKIAPPPTTTGAAGPPRDQPEQSASSEKSTSDKKQAQPLDETDRETLYQDFLKWQFNRNLFGSP